MLAATQFGAAVMTLLLFLRIVYILGANPIGELGQELVYLRIRELRTPALLGLLVLLVETIELSLPLLRERRYITNPETVLAYANTTQAILIAVAALLTVLVIRRYTHRALDRRIRESMETLAYLEGQRRRRRTGDRRTWETDEE